MPGWIWQVVRIDTNIVAGFFIIIFRDLLQSPKCRQQRGLLFFIIFQNSQNAKQMKHIKLFHLHPRHVRWTSRNWDQLLDCSSSPQSLNLWYHTDHLVLGCKVESAQHSRDACWAQWASCRTWIWDKMSSHSSDTVPGNRMVSWQEVGMKQHGRKVLAFKQCDFFSKRLQKG